jgi:hypothetical protein
MNAKRIFLSGIIAIACLTTSVVMAAPRAQGGSASGARFSSGAHFTASRTAFGRAGINNGNWHHHHNHFVFVGGFGYPFGYPWYDPYYYPYGYYDYYGYNRPDVYQGGSAYDDGLVGQVQHRLARAGYYHGSVDGVMGPETRRAIRTYERSNNLRVDGAISDRLLDTMNIR